MKALEFRYSDNNVDPEKAKAFELYAKQKIGNKMGFVLSNSGHMEVSIRYEGKAYRGQIKGNSLIAEASKEGDFDNNFKLAFSNE